MDPQDRDMIIRVEQQAIRVEQQVKDSVANQQSIMQDLKEIFHRIESNSKNVVQIKGDLKAYFDSNSVKGLEYERRINDLEKKCEEVKTTIAKEREERLASINEEKGKRESFETTIISSFRASKIFVTIISGLAAFFAAIVVILQFVNYLKG